jgi:hypothetical protein
MKAITSFTGDFFFLSNFYEARVTLDGITYPTSEHAYQAMKTLDMAERARILKCETAGKVKKLGKTVKLRSDWEHVKLRVMKHIVCLKFLQNMELMNDLVETYPAHLEEGNTWGDTYWGTVDGMGENHLGKILMRARTLIGALAIVSDSAQ